MRHFAGNVCYMGAHFLDKNNDSVFKELLSLGESSSQAICKHMFPAGGAAEAGDSQGMNYLVSLPRRIVTVYVPLAAFLIVLLFPFYWMVMCISGETEAGSRPGIYASTPTSIMTELSPSPSQRPRISSSTFRQRARTPTP